MTDPTLIADLIRAGVDPELVNRVSVGMLLAFQAGVSTRTPVDFQPDKMAENRRAYDRERYHLRKKPTGTPPETAETAETPKPTTILKKEDSKNLSKIVRATRIPPDWTLNEVDRKFAIDRGMQLVRIPREAEQFKNYWLSKSGQSATSPDWSAKWRTWVGNALKFQPGDPPPAPPPDPNLPPMHLRPPWMLEGITEAEWEARRMEMIRGLKNGHDKNPEVRGNTAMGQGGHNDAPKLRFEG